MALRMTINKRTFPSIVSYPIQPSFFARESFKESFKTMNNHKETREINRIIKISKRNFLNRLLGRRGKRIFFKKFSINLESRPLFVPVDDDADLKRFVSNIFWQHVRPIKKFHQIFLSMCRRSRQLIIADSLALVYGGKPD